MTPRELAERRELELALDFFARRAMQNAGDLADVKVAFEQASAELNALKPAPAEPTPRKATRKTR